MFLYVYPPMPTVNVAPTPGASTEATQLLVLAELQAINTNQYLPVRSKATINFASTNVTNAAYVELISSVGATAIKKVHIFMSSGEPLLLAFGAAASEVDQVYILPGGNGFVDLEIPATTRVSVKAVNAVTVSEGSILVNFLG